MERRKDVQGFFSFNTFSVQMMHIFTTTLLHLKYILSSQKQIICSHAFAANVSRSLFKKKILNFDVQTNPLKNLFILFLTDSVYWCPRK